MNNLERGKLVIEAILPKDALEVQKLILESSKEVYIKGGKTADEIEINLKEALSDQSIKKLEESISNLSENEKEIVARVGSRIVGYFAVEKGVDKNTIQAAFVLPEYQGLGIATRMWNNVKPFLNPEVDTYLGVYLSSTNAINFYKWLGFVETGKIITGRILEAMEMVLKGDN
jgi:ribosomal protein S18 acetylase RimI-like enzyme